MNTDKEVLNVQEAAELLRVSVWTVREAAHNGEIPARKVGRAWRFSRRALIEHLASLPSVGPEHIKRDSVPSVTRRKKEK